jgi:ABC-type sugar transport system ATPase subunit
MVSSELPEVIGLSDRVMVMREGRISAELAITDATEERIMANATRAVA